LRIVILLFSGVLLAAPKPASALTLQEGNIVLLESGSPDSIFVVDRLTGAETLLCQCSKLYSSMDVAVYAGKVYVAGYLDLGGGQHLAGVLEVDPTDGSQRVVSAGNRFGWLQGIAVESNGNILVSDARCSGCSGGQGVLRVDRSTGAQQIVSSGSLLTSIWGLAVAPNGMIYAAADVAPTNWGGVVEIDPTSGVQRAVTVGDGDSAKILGPSDLIVHPGTGRLYVYDIRYRGSFLQDEVRIFSVDAATGSATLITSSIEGLDRGSSGGSGQLRGIGIYGNTLFALDYHFGSNYGGVNRVDPSAGLQGYLTGESDFWRPSGLAVVQPVPEPAQWLLELGTLATLAVARCLRGERRL